MSYYVEIELHVYDEGQTTTGVGPFKSHEKAEAVAARLQERLRTGQAKKYMDDQYGEGEYNVIALALRLRTPSQAYLEMIGK